MATPFSRTMRSLQADNFRPSLIFLAMALMLIMAWLGWFTLSQINIYETSDNIYAVQGGNLAATFSNDIVTKVQPGQSATFELQVDNAGQIYTVEATVFEIHQSTGEIVFFPYTSLDYLFRNPQSISGSVSLAAETLSPAALLLQSSGKAAP
ncbi:MAG: hypothetical protein ACPG7F_18550 [Aggregatilineales bacterium]